jgi:hypothetical protein
MLLEVGSNGLNDLILPYGPSVNAFGGHSSNDCVGLHAFRRTESRSIVALLALYAYADFFMLTKLRKRSLEAADLAVKVGMRRYDVVARL